MHILIPCLEFPPFCGPGSLRLGRFAKEFALQGHRVSVVTASIADYRKGFPKRRALDYGLLDTIKESVDIYRTEAVDGTDNAWREREEIVLDDKQVWNSYAYEIIREIIETQAVDVVYTSSNPLSIHLAGLDLKADYGLPWIAEFRDAWTTHGMKIWSNKKEYEAQRLLEAKILRTADHVILNTPTIGQEVSEAFQLKRSDFSIVTNGYSADDFTSAVEKQVTSDGPLEIVHFGTLLGSLPLLVSFGD